MAKPFIWRSLSYSIGFRMFNLCVVPSIPIKVRRVSHFKPMKQCVKNISRLYIRIVRRLHCRDRFILPPYEDCCRLLDMRTLSQGQQTSGACFILDLLSGLINSNALLCKINFNARVRSLHAQPFLYPNFHRTNNGHSDIRDRHAKLSFRSTGQNL